MLLNAEATGQRVEATEGCNEGWHGPALQGSVGPLRWGSIMIQTDLGLLAIGLVLGVLGCASLHAGLAWLWRSHHSGHRRA